MGPERGEWKGNDVLESEPAAPRAQFAVGVCARRTRASGEHVPTGHQRPAVATEPKGSRDSLFLSLFIWELCVSGVEASSDKIESCKFPDCRVVRIFILHRVYCLLVN